MPSYSEKTAKSQLIGMYPTVANTAPYNMYTLFSPQKYTYFIIIPNYIILNFNLAEMGKC